MIVAVLLAGVLLLPSYGLGSTREVPFAGNVFGSNIVPTFDNGFLAVYELNGTISIYTREGLAARSIPAPQSGTTSQAAIDTDGTVALAVTVPDPRRGQIAVFDGGGGAAVAIDTGEYRPSFLCFAPDHTIWTTGSQWPSRDGTTDYAVLRHYSRDGRELGRFWPASSFPALRVPAKSVTGLWGLRIAGNRIGAVLGHGSRDAVWVEGGLDGKETGRWPIDMGGSPAAFTPGSAVYAQGTGGRIFALDRSSRSWIAVPIQSSDAILLGADGDELVFAVRGSNRLRWVNGAR